MSQMKAGAILSYLSIFITILIALVYTPIMIRLLGQSEYGLFALIGSVSAYFSILDMGLGNAIVRYTARNRAIGDKDAESKLNGMFIILYSFIGILTIIVGFVFYKTIDSIFGASLTTVEIEKAKLMVIILIFNFAISFPLATFGSIIQAYERFIVTKLVGMFRTLLIPIITLPILFLGYGSVAMVLVTTLVNIACLFFNVYYCFKQLKIKFFFGKIDYQLFKEIIRYSFFVFLGVIADQLYWNTDQFILGIVAGTLPVAVYAIAMQFKTLYMQFSTAISGLFLPRASIMIANKVSNEELTGAMIKYGRVQYFILSFILSGFILFGQQFINLWAGTGYGNAYYIALIVMIPLTVPLIQNFGISILYAKSLQGFRSIVLITIALLNVIITIPLAKIYGGIGAAFATAISLTLGNIILMNLYYYFKIGLNISLFWRNIFLISIPVAFTNLIGHGVNYIMPQDGILFLILKIISYSILFVSIMLYFAFNNYEKTLFLSLVKKLRNVVLRK